MARFTTFDDQASEVKESYNCFLFSKKKARHDTNGFGWAAWVLNELCVRNLSTRVQNVLTRLTEEIFY